MWRQEVRRPKLLKCHVQCVKRQTEPSVKRVVLNGGKVHLKDLGELGDAGIEIFITGCFTLEAFRSRLANEFHQREGDMNNVHTCWRTWKSLGRMTSCHLWCAQSNRLGWMHEDATEILAHRKLSVACMRMLGSKVWARATDRTKILLEAKLRYGVQLRFYLLASTVSGWKMTEVFRWIDIVRSGRTSFRWRRGRMYWE